MKRTTLILANTWIVLGVLFFLSGCLIHGGFSIPSVVTIVSAYYLRLGRKWAWWILTVSSVLSVNFTVCMILARQLYLYHNRWEPMLFVASGILDAGTVVLLLQDPPARWKTSDQPGGGHGDGTG